MSWTVEKTWRGGPPMVVTRQVGPVKLIVFRRIASRDEWYLICNDLGIGHQMLVACTLENAKAEALKKARRRAVEISRAFEQVAAP